MSKNFRKLENLAGKPPTSPREGRSHLTYIAFFLKHKNASCQLGTAQPTTSTKAQLIQQTAAARTSLPRQARELRGNRPTSRAALWLCTSGIPVDHREATNGIHSPLRALPPPAQGHPGTPRLSPHTKAMSEQPAKRWEKRNRKRRRARGPWASIPRATAATALPSAPDCPDPKRGGQGSWCMREQLIKILRVIIKCFLLY